eukprot:gene11815-5146_t
MNDMIKHLQEGMTPEQFFALNESLQSKSLPKIFDAEKVRKLIKNLKKIPNKSDAAVLSSLCSEESFVRNLFDLEVHKPIMAVIDSCKDGVIKEVLLFGLAELCLDQLIVKKMIEEGLVLPFFLKYLKSNVTELSCYSIKALTTLFMTPETIGLLLKDDSILETVISHINNGKFIFRMSMEMNEKGKIFDNESQVLGNTLRFVMTLGQVPVIRKKFLELGILEKLTSIKKPTNKFDIPIYESSLALFKEGKLFDIPTHQQAQKAMESRIQNPSEMVNERRCAYCDKLATVSAPLKNCSVCKKVKYCNRECQVAHWKQHKIYCKKSE